MRTIAAKILILILVSSASCRKRDYPEPAPRNESVFVSQLLVDGKPLQIRAGIDGYYMYSSFSHDTSGVYSFTGELKQEGCTNCTNVLKIQMYDTKTSSPGSQVDIADAMRPGVRRFVTGVEETASVLFSMQYNKNAEKVHWDFGDGSSSDESNPEHLFAKGDHQVHLTVENNEGCISHNRALVTVGDLKQPNAFITGSVSDTIITLKCDVAGGTPPYTYSWDFGDQSLGAGATVTHTFSHKGGYHIRVNVKDALGETVSAGYNTVVGDDNSGCAANFTAAVKSDLKKRRNVLARGVIQFTDENGVTYSSENPAQPGGSVIELISVEDFVPNEHGQQVKKVKLRFNCTLYNGARTVSLQGTDVTVGFAYQ